MIILLLLLGGFIFFQRGFLSSQTQHESKTGVVENLVGGVLDTVNPLSIASLRKTEFSGSDIVIEETLSSGSNYDRFIASYQSEGLKIYALLTVPQGARPENGWPVVIFNHGYIPPAEYRTTERYIAYTDGFSRNGYVVFRSDYRGHGSSEGQAAGGYGSNAYTVDVLNGLASVKKLKSSTINGSDGNALVVDPNNIGMWGHSMGGFITLRSMVVSKEIKAGVIWGGVVASYPDLIANWRRGPRANVSPSPLPSGARRWRDALQEEHGDPASNPAFWNSISANYFIDDISGPLQLHHGSLDESVPVEFSQNLEKELQGKGKTVEYYEYPGDDHDITANFSAAIQRSVAFFDRYSKNN